MLESKPRDIPHSKEREGCRLAAKPTRTMRRTFITAIICFSAWVVPLADRAIASQVLPTEVVSSGASPIRIDSCAAALIDKPGPGGVLTSILLTKHNFYIDAAVDFTDIAPQPIAAVRFTFDVHDTFDEVAQSLALDWLGNRSLPASLFEHAATSPARLERWARRTRAPGR